MDGFQRTPSTHVRYRSTFSTPTQPLPANAGPSFLVDADCVIALSSPSEFYESLMAGVAGSRERITLASLYVGTGPLEQELVDAIRHQLAKEPRLEVAVQLDMCRALRVAKPHVLAGSQHAPTATAGQGGAVPSAAMRSSASTIQHGELRRLEKGAWQTAVPADAASDDSSVVPAPTTEKHYVSSAQHLLNLYRPVGAGAGAGTQTSRKAGAGQRSDSGSAQIQQEAGESSTQTHYAPFRASAVRSDVGGGGSPGIESRVRLGLTLMPQLRGLLGRLLPPRWIEATGVFHLKAYVFDRHTIILSGANLSQDYFTNRQDRYVVISTKQGGGASSGSSISGIVSNTAHDFDDTGVGAFADYLHELIGSISSAPGSHVLLGDGTVTHIEASGDGARAGGADAARTSSVTSSSSSAAAPSSSTERPGADSLPVPAYDPSLTPPQLNAMYSEALRSILDSSSCKAPALPANVVDFEDDGDATSALDRNMSAARGRASSEAISSTAMSTTIPRGKVLISPRLQLGFLGVRHDEAATHDLLASLRPWPLDVAHIATGYFNLTRSFTDAIIRGKDSMKSAGDNGFSRSDSIGSYVRSIVAMMVGRPPQVYGAGSGLAHSFAALSPRSAASGSTTPSPAAVAAAHLSPSASGGAPHPSPRVSSATGPPSSLSSSSVHILTAAPEANGFFRARGISGAIPVAYSEIERRFYDMCEQAGRLMQRRGATTGQAPSSSSASSSSSSLLRDVGAVGGGDASLSSGSQQQQHPQRPYPHEAQQLVMDGPGVAIHEYSRQGWTFHCKGLWLVRQRTSSSTGVGSGDGDGGVEAGAGQPPSTADAVEMVSLVGSPNFGVRSSERDLELQCSFRTQDPGLVRRLECERDRLFGVHRPPQRDGDQGQPPSPSSASGNIDHSGAQEGSSGPGVAVGRRSYADAVRLGTKPSRSPPPPAASSQHSSEQQPPFPSPVNKPPTAGSASSDGDAHADVHVRPVGPHLGPNADVWSQSDRQLRGWTWSHGLWIHAGWRILAPFF